MITYNEISSQNIDRIKEIYLNENWKAYLKDDSKLIKAFDNSLYILGVFCDERLAGFIRCVGDGEHIVVVQDLIIDIEYRNKGLGKQLFTMILEKYKSVRTISLITDINDKVSNNFYISLGMKKLEIGDMVSYFR